MSKNKKNILKNNNFVEKNHIEENIKKNTKINNLGVNFLEGAEAYYSERYGWTLRKSK